MTYNFEQLILDYEKTAKDFLQLLKEVLCVDNPFRAIFEKKILRNGPFLSDYFYRFHGIGVRIETNDEEENTIVDIEIEGSWSYAGFDAWRLLSFAKAKGGFEGITEDVFDKKIRDLADEGKVVKRTETMLRHLYLRTEEWDWTDDGLDT